MGGNQRMYLQEFDLYKLLQSILGKLNNWKTTLWNNGNFKHKLYKNILHVLTQIHDWCIWLYTGSYNEQCLAESQSEHPKIELATIMNQKS